jgi:hypothetical protein
VRFEVLATSDIKMAVFWDVGFIYYSLCYIYTCFELDILIIRKLLYIFVPTVSLQP